MIRALPLALPLMACLIVEPATADPWIAPGDARLRHDLQLLSDAGATRLNVYAGIAGGYVVTEPANTYAPGLHPLGLSDRATGQFTELTVPLIIQDRMFDTTGQLFFPNLGINPEHPFWVPEFVGDVIVVNGKAWPYHTVQPKRYRFIFLNGSNARAYELYHVDSGAKTKVKKNGKPSANPTVAGPAIYVIGNDQGLLQTPQQVNPNLIVNGKLAMMPGERYEFIIDFSTVAGQTIEMAGSPSGSDRQGCSCSLTPRLPAAARDLDGIESSRQVGTDRLPCVPTRDAAVYASSA